MIFRWLFRHRILYRFFHDFGCNFGSIFHPFSTLWPSFWHTFSVSIFSWFLDAIQDDFWSKIYNPNSNPERHFFELFSCFFWASFQGWILDGFWWILVGFWMDFHEFWTHFGASGFVFSLFLDPFDSVTCHLFIFCRTNCLSQVLQFFDLRLQQ